MIYKRLFVAGNITPLTLKFTHPCLAWTGILKKLHGTVSNSALAIRSAFEGFVGKMSSAEMADCGLGML